MTGSEKTALGEASFLGVQLVTNKSPERQSLQRETKVPMGLRQKAPAVNRASFEL